MVKSVQEILENEVLCIAETSFQLLQISWEYMHCIMEITKEVDESAKLASLSMHDDKGEQQRCIHNQCAMARLGNLFQLESCINLTSQTS